MRRWAAVLVFNVALIVIVVALVEGLMVALLAFPSLAEYPLLRSIGKSLYMQQRTVVQFLPECARYDSAVTYTLKPGSCLFENAEFKTRLRINSLGVRDDEESLAAPPVLVLGDSHAMGWGVEQGEAFPQVLELLTGLRVLNAGTPSYGTVRALRLLERLDTSSLRCLVVQYTDNDFGENRTLHERGDLRIAEPTTYREWVRWQTERPRYFFGRHVASMIKSSLDRLASRDAPRDGVGRPPPGTPASLEAAYFLHALAQAPMALDDVHVIVLEIGPDAQNDREFTTAVERAARSWRSPPWERLTVVDVSHVLDRKHYYILDNHMRPAGHRRVAEQIQPVVAEKCR